MSYNKPIERKTTPNARRMMTLTHDTHFGLTNRTETNDSILWDGTLAACKRMAFSHGMEIEKYEGRILASEGGKALYAPVDVETNSFVRIVFKGGGMIQKQRDCWTLVMPLTVWLND